MNRRDVVIGLAGLIAGGGALIGTGAFDTVEAERSVAVETAGDADAFLGVEPFPGSPNSDYVDASGDTIVIDITGTGTNAPGAGVNENAVTAIDRLLMVTNNGTQDVNLSIELPSSVSGVAFTLASERGNANPTDLTDTTYELGSGQSISVDLKIDTTTSGGYTEPTSGSPYQITIRAVAV